MRPILIALLAALVLGNWPAYGMLLLVDDAAGQGGVASQTSAPQDSWREAHIDGAYRVRGITLFVLPLLLLLAALLSFILPEKKGADRHPRDDDFFFQPQAGRTLNEVEHSF